MGPAPTIPLSARSENKEKRMSKTGKRTTSRKAEEAEEEGPTLFEQRVGATMGDTALSGMVGAHVGD